MFDVLLGDGFQATVALVGLVAARRKNGRPARGREFAAMTPDLGVVRHEKVEPHSEDYMACGKGQVYVLCRVEDKVPAGVSAPGFASAPVSLNSQQRTLARQSRKNVCPAEAGRYIAF